MKLVSKRRFHIIGAALALAVSLMMSYQPARADERGPTYSAGTRQGPVCYCPVLVGNCVCGRL